MYCVFDGIDGCGKDSQRDLLASHLESKGETVRTINEPYEGTPIGKLIRQFLKSGDYPESHAPLFLADRIALQTSVVKPALERGESILCARSFLSTLTYQQENWPLPWLFDLHQELPIKPDFTFVLDLDAKVALERARRRPGHMEYYERLDVQKRNQQRFLDLLEYNITNIERLVRPGKVILIDANGTPEEVHQRVLESINGQK